jgi:hypothetical protein
MAHDSQATLIILAHDRFFGHKDDQFGFAQLEQGLRRDALFP